MVLLRYYSAPAWRGKVKPSKFIPLRSQVGISYFVPFEKNMFYMFFVQYKN